MGDCRSLNTDCSVLQVPNIYSTMGDCWSITLTALSYKSQIYTPQWGTVDPLHLLICPTSPRYIYSTMGDCRSFTLTALSNKSHIYTQIYTPQWEIVDQLHLLLCLTSHKYILHNGGPSIHYTYWSVCHEQYLYPTWFSISFHFFEHHESVSPPLPHNLPPSSPDLFNTWLVELRTEDLCTPTWTPSAHWDLQYVSCRQENIQRLLHPLSTLNPPLEPLPPTELLNMCFVDERT